MTVDADPDGHTVVLKAATPEERAEVARFRYEVYVAEQGKESIPGVDHARRTLSDALDDHADVFYARQGDRVVATVRVLVGDADRLPETQRTAYHLRAFEAWPGAVCSFTSRLMVARELRGSLALNMLLASVYAHGLSAGVAFDFCHCAPALVALYEHLGYRRYTPNFVDPHVGYRVPLVLALRDADHLRRIRSPFWRTLRSHAEQWAGDPVARWLQDTFPMTTQPSRWLVNEQTFWEFLTSKLRPKDEDAETPLLRGLTPAEQRKVLSHGTVLTVQAGDPIIRAGDVGNEMFVLLSGVVEVLLPETGRMVTSLDAGEVFGEVAFIANTVRSADVRAASRAEVLVVSQTYLDRLMKTAPDLAAKVLRNLATILCERLVYTNRNWDVQPEDA